MSPDRARLVLRATAFLLATAVAAGFWRGAREEGGPPSLALSPLSEADRAYDADDHARAARLYRGYLDLFPYDFAAVIRLGRCHLLLKEWRAAADAFERHQRFNPRRAELYEGLAFAYANLSIAETADPVAREAHRARARAYASAALASGARLAPELLGRLGLPVVAGP
ncbi:MAG: hypothetical protein SF051_14605 [Elusimicrobiota bacterium]|nr:hypothetical protein [Elusimicrobiota bacterium]